MPLASDWILLLDADETMTPELVNEIRHSIQNPDLTGYYVSLQQYFLCRHLKHSGKLVETRAFRKGRGHFECRLRDPDVSMADMLVHEHVVVDGTTARLRHPVIHHNVESLSRYIQKRNEYSNWEAKVWLNPENNSAELPPALFGSQAQRRRWLKQRFLLVPGSPLFFFLYKYLLRLGFLEGVPGLIYCGLQGIQLFHVKAKIYELKKKAGTLTHAQK